VDQIVQLGHRLDRVEINEYYPDIVKMLLTRMQKSNAQKFALLGFSTPLKWLARILSENSVEFELYDTNDLFVGYDCCNKYIRPFSDFDSCDIPIVICSEDTSVVKDLILQIADSGFSSNLVIYDTTQEYNPLRQDEPFKSIISKAEMRARSMISDSQLLDLIQLCKLTSGLTGDVVEFGSLYGGSGAVLAESLSFFGVRNLFLCDTFSGIPKAKYGFDERWNNSFADNSYAEVSSCFDDLNFVEVVKGDVFKTAESLSNPLSLVYIGTDTYGSAEYLLDLLWPKLQVGGIVQVCDYGSYPNCLPITALCERFERHHSLISFRTSHCGIYFQKT
jgi:hypothetical protein